MTKKQKEFNKICPECGGELYEVEGETETLLYCRDCDVSIDSGGGIIA